MATVTVAGSTPFHLVTVTGGVIDEEIAKQHIHIVLLVDVSASMNTLCANNVSRMDNILQTMSRILPELANMRSGKVSVDVVKFGNIPRTVVADWYLACHDMHQLLSIMNKELTANHGATNLEQAFDHITDLVNVHRRVYPKHAITVITFTDGEIVGGPESAAELAACMPPHAHHVLVGYGARHNSTFLHKLSEATGADYHFIDDHDNAGTMCSEIVHRIMNCCAREMWITCDAPGQFYCALTNAWTDTQLYVGRLMSGQSRHFYIRGTTCVRFAGGEAQVYKHDEDWPIYAHRFRLRVLGIMYTAINMQKTPTTIRELCDDATAACSAIRGYLDLHCPPTIGAHVCSPCERDLLAMLHEDLVVTIDSFDIPADKGGNTYLIGRFHTQMNERACNAAGMPVKMVSGGSERILLTSRVLRKRLPAAAHDEERMEDSSSSQPPRRVVHPKPVKPPVYTPHVAKYRNPYTSDSLESLMNRCSL